MLTKDTIFRLSTFCKADGPLSKSIALGDDGQPHSNADDCRMSHGTAMNFGFQNLTELADHINDLDSVHALSLGTIDGQDDNELVRLVTEARLTAYGDAIARTKEYFAFEEGEPGLLLIDFDKKGISPEILERIEAAGGLWAVLCEVFPDLIQAGYIRRASTSAGLYNSETGEKFPGSGGEHIYLAVQDASDIPRATKVLHQRLWLAGLGWIWIGRIGQLLERSVIDQSVGSPERLVFEGAPVLEPPLAQSQKARRAIAVEGRLIDSKAVFPDLTQQEGARYRAKVQAEKAALKPEAKTRQSRADKGLAKKLARRSGLTDEQARAQISRRHQGELLPLHPLEFDDRALGKVTVGDVLMDPDRFIEQTLADPLEGVGYGRCKAKLFRRPDGSLWINSFAHGGAQYDLRHDAGSVRAALEGLERETNPNDIVAALASAHLETSEEEELLRAIKDATGVTLGELRTLLKRAKRFRSNVRRSDANTRLAEEDPRVALPAPAASAELTDVVTQIDEILGNVVADIPPFRTLASQLAYVDRRPPSKLHQLVSEGEEQPPAPDQLTIQVAGEPEATMMIEEHIRFEIENDEDSMQSAPKRLSLPFVRAYMGWKESQLPRVRGISTLPLVLPGGVLKAMQGLDRELELIFELDEELVRRLEKTHAVSLQEAKKAYDWLLNNWLVDVDATEEGKAIVIALALTVIERHLLAEFPAFFVSAAQRGSGKTTVINMISTALSGVMASAASWSFDEEERRKAIFSYLREGSPLVTYDNIPRGSAISCPTLERVLTAPELKDRVLGENRTETVPASTVIAFTGNNIHPKGDMASRSLVANLVSDRTDPENREFEHEDPIGWTRENRNAILQRLYQILLLARDKPNRSKTRFKTWWNLIGHPLEMISGVDFEDLFRANDVFDEEAQGAAEFISLMKRYLEMDGKCSREFSASEVAKLADDKWHGSGSRSADPNEPDPSALKSALEAASGRPFSGGTVTAHRVARKLAAIEDRPVEVDGQMLQLKVIRDHEGNRYRIEQLG